MNIGLDIDGCLTDIEQFHLQYGIPFFEKTFHKKLVHERGKTIQQLFDCTKKEEAKFWLRHMIKYTIKDPVREGAAEFTRWAYENGHKIYIITSRAFSTMENVIGKLARWSVRRWLKKSGIRYENITFCDEDKLPALKKYHVNYMVEDDPDNIIAMHDITKVICINAKCNEHLVNECACRCDSFEEELEFIRSECERLFGMQTFAVR